LIEAVTDYAIYMPDSEGIVASWNPGAARFKDIKLRKSIILHFRLCFGSSHRVHGAGAIAPFADMTADFLKRRRSRR
jgi:hypothetical protein